MAKVTGKLVKLALNFDKEKKGGGTWKAHGVRLDVNGELKEFIFPAAGVVGKFVSKIGAELKEGDTVTVETSVNDKGFDSVQRVSKGDGMFKKSFEKKDNSGQIKGMVLNNAIAIAIAKGDTSLEAIVSAATTVIAARAEVDKLVAETLPVEGEAATDDPFASSAPKQAASPF